MAGPVARLLARGRAIPWARVYLYGEWAYRKGKAVRGSLSESERRELGQLLKKSRGRRRNLSRRELDRLQELVQHAFQAASRA